MSHKPVILITPAIAGAAGYRLHRSYADMVAELGGLPLIVPQYPGAADDVLALCDGLIVSGSDPGEIVARDRLAFERALVSAAIARRCPVLGICHGMQVIGQVLGGTLATISSAGVEGAGENGAGEGGAEPHCPANTPDRLAHEVEVTGDTALRALVGCDRFHVNSFHRHELRGPGAFDVAARSAGDGVIEAIIGRTPAFCMGLQWHPERLLTLQDRAILGHFLAMCRPGGAG